MTVTTERSEIDNWEKVSEHGIPIPDYCPECGSEETSLSGYGPDSDLSITCDGCNIIISDITIDGMLVNLWVPWKSEVLATLNIDSIEGYDD